MIIHSECIHETEQNSVQDKSWLSVRLFLDMDAMSHADFTQIIPSQKTSKLDTESYVLTLHAAHLL